MPNMTILKTLKKFFFINTFIMIKEQFVLLKYENMELAKKFLQLVNQNKYV